MKKLYTFSVNKTIKKEEREETESGTLVKTVDELVPVSIFIKKLGARDRNEITSFYAAKFGEAIASGLLTKEAIQKNLSDSGGLGKSKVEIERLNEIDKKNDELTLEFHKRSLAGKDTKDLQLQILDLRTEALVIYSKMEEFFSYSAESKAMRETITFATLNYTYFTEPESQFFRGEIISTKLSNFYDCLDEPEKYKFENDVYVRASTIMTHHLQYNVDKEEDFDSLIAYWENESSIS